MQSLLQAADEVFAGPRHEASPHDRAVLRGWVEIRKDGVLIGRSRNMLVTAGLEAIVDSFVTGTPVLNIFKYVGVGTSAAETTAGMTALTAECAGGSYARLVATQAEGATTKTYKLTGTWTNNTAGQVALNEYGIFSLAAAGTMLARVSSGDGGGPLQVTLEVTQTVDITWNIAWADA